MYSWYKKYSDPFEFCALCLVTVFAKTKKFFFSLINVPQNPILTETNSKFVKKEKLNYYMVISF